MTFYDWIYSNYPKDSEIDGRWGALHIGVLLGCLIVIVLIAFLGKRNEKSRRAIILSLACLIAVFELVRRVINLSRGNMSGITDFLIIILPRPWCAISCWLIVAAVFVKKKFFYNVTSISALICAIIFFAYPSVGFNDKYILFENVYSIATHSLLLITSISLVTLGFTDFKLKARTDKLGVFKEAITMGAIFVYAFIEIFVLRIEDDPLYFMPGNDVQEFVGVDYPIYLVIYIIFLAFYFSVFYAIQYLVDKHRKNIINQRNCT